MRVGNCALASGILVLGMAACADPDGTPPETTVRVDTIGDTVVVVSPMGGEWGAPATLEATTSIGLVDGPPEFLFEAPTSLAVDDAGNVYVLDRVAREVRAFDASGEHIRTYGRRGQGPGELANPSAVAVLSDGRVAVRDSRNRRVQLYLPDGTRAGEWSFLHPAHFSSERLWVDDRDAMMVVTKDERADFMTADEIIVRVAGDGTILDTIPLPIAHVDVPQLEATFENETGMGRATGRVPYWPNPDWGLMPDGRLLLATGADYRIDLRSPDGSTLRIGRAYQPVPVTAEERDRAERRTIDGMRNTDPNWRWTGPSIPGFKPPFSSVYVGTHGRIWTRASVESVEEPNPDHDPSDPNSHSTRLVSPWLFDVFEADGTYLGQVTTPPEFQASTAVFDGDRVWTVLRDELGVARVVRYDLRLPN